MPRLSLGLGVQAVSKVKSGGAAPTEISVATTNTIIVTGASYFNGTYTKLNPSQYESTNLNYLQFDFTLGSPARWYFYDGDASFVEADPSAFNALFIPRTFTADITLTAA
jgi:hypothetical protein